MGRWAMNNRFLLLLGNLFLILSWAGFASAQIQSGPCIEGVGPRGERLPCGYTPPTPQIYSPPPPSWPTAPTGPSPEELRQQEEEARRRAEEEARQRWLEEERQRAFEREKEEAVRTLKGVTPVPLGMKGVERDTGIKDIKPARDPRDVSTAWKQIHCGVSLSLKAAAAAGQGDFYEASYLKEQAAQAMSGGSLGVKCPDNIPPEPKLSPQKGPSPATPQTELYKILLKSTNEQVEKLVNIEQRVKEATEKKRQAEKEKTERQAEVERLKLRPVDPKKPEEVKQKKKEVGEAEALLQKAIDDDAAASKAIEGLKKEKEGAQQNLQRNKEIFSKVETNPALAEGFLKQMTKKQVGK
jgi:hypothetical protein